MATGEWLSAPKGDLEQDTTLRIVEEDGRPSFFRQEIAPSEQTDNEAQSPSSAVFTEDIIGDKSNNQRSSHGNSTLVGVRTSKGSSTAETTQSDSTQDTSPQKCEAPMPEASQPQSKGTRPPTPTYWRSEVANRLKVDCSVGSSGSSRACNTYAFLLFYAHDRSRISDHQKRMRLLPSLTRC